MPDLPSGLPLSSAVSFWSRVLDLGSHALVERFAGRGDLGQEGPRPGVVTGTQGRQGRLVQAERSALLGQRDLGDQLVGLGLDAELAGLGLGSELLGRLVIAVLVQLFGLAEQCLATIRRGCAAGRLGRPRGVGCRRRCLDAAVPGDPSARPGRAQAGIVGRDLLDRRVGRAVGRDRGRDVGRERLSPVLSRSASVNLAAAAS